MLRTFIAVAAVSGTLAFGGAGVIGLSGTAGADAPITATTPSSVTPARHAARCATAEKVATRIQARQTKAAVWLPKAQTREAAATAAGHTKVAARIDARISRVERWEVKDNARLAKIASRCGTADLPG
jgi:hypothetical protein